MQLKKLQEKMHSSMSKGAKQHGFYNRVPYDDFIEACIFLESIVEAGLLAPIDISKSKVELKGSPQFEDQDLNDFFRKIFSRADEEIKVMRAEDLRSKFRSEFGSVFCYEFSQGDLDRVQELINALRNELMNCNGLEDGHRQRLMRRLELLQAELHKKISNLDRFWGLIGDAGVVLGKLGQDAKPLVDRIREITTIVWQTQARSEELPSGLPPPLLGKDTSEDQ